MTEWMRQAVDDVYSKGLLPLAQAWSAEDNNRYLEILTSRLDIKAADLSDELARSAIQEWKDRRGGQHPDYETTVRLRAAARQNAREAIVRQELYDKIPASHYDQEADPQPPQRIRGVAWEHRWTDPTFRAEPSEEIEELTDLVWPTQSVMFRVKAAYLLATRLEDGLPLPNAPRHHLARDLAPRILEELKADGYPAE